MDYTPEQVNNLNGEFRLIFSRYTNILMKMSSFCNHLKKMESKEFVFHGVCRRYGLMCQCVGNVFSKYPLDRDVHELFDETELDYLTINIQSFCINTSGILDNLAWVYVLENELEVDFENQVGFFKFVNPKNKIKFPESFCDYVSPKIISWHDTYLKRYRDTLAHRIPLYVPPYAVRKGNESVREIVNCFAESRLKDSQAIPFHAQMITDFKTIEEVVEKSLELIWDGHNGWRYSRDT